MINSYLGIANICLLWARQRQGSDGEEMSDAAPKLAYRKVAGIKTCHASITLQAARLHLPFLYELQ